LCGARRLGGLEFLEGFVVGAADGVLVARELGESVAFAASIERHTEETGVLVVEQFLGGTGGLRGGIAAVLGLAGAFDAIGEDAGLDAQDAAKSPLGAGQLAEAGLLEGVGGVLLGEDGVAGAAAVGAGMRTGRALG
jgi:hypothetical protein